MISATNMTISRINTSLFVFLWCFFSVNKNNHAYGCFTHINKKLPFNIPHKIIVEKKNFSRQHIYTKTRN